MKCTQCGKSVKAASSFCTHCGNSLLMVPSDTPTTETISSTTRKYRKQLLIIGVIVICLIGYFFGPRCKNGLCPLPSSSKSDFCFVHVCSRNNCTNKKAAGKDYCYTHSPTTSSEISYTPEAGEDVLVFSNINNSHNSSYTVCTGTVKNTGRKTYSFVEVKGKFKNAYGTVLDTDWTYAVGSEGLAPGESTTFRLSADKNRNTTQCTMEILDYQKE